MAQTAPVETERPVGDEDVAPDVPWIVIVWNDPINLMSYVAVTTTSFDQTDSPFAFTAVTT